MTFIFDLDELHREALTKPPAERAAYFEHAIRSGLRIIKEREAYRQVACDYAGSDYETHSHSKADCIREVDEEAQEILRREENKV